MNKTTSKNTILVCALLGVMAAGQAKAADIRYMNSGDYLEPTGWQGGVIPGTNDTARFNWGNNTVTLAGEAPLLRNFQMGVDESGQLVVNSGGKLITTGTQNSTVGNNNVCTGLLTVNAGGEVDVTNVLFVGAGATGILTNDGGTVNITSHLWVGSSSAGVGSIYISNGGILSVGGNIGLGTVNASTPSGGKGSVYVQDGGVLKLNQISAVTSIQPNSVLDISGSGQVIIPTDLTAVMSAYTNATGITAYGGLGTVGIDYDTNTLMTTLFAIAPASPPPTAAVWNPAVNFPDTNGLWNVSGNWDVGAVPASVTVVTFNVVGAIPCTVTNNAHADSLDLGDNGPGGTLIITNGGSLTCEAVNQSVIGNNSNALMVVESGGSASFGADLELGFIYGSEGTLVMNGGTVSVAGTLGLGLGAGTGTAQIIGGQLNLSQMPSFYGNSVLDVTGTGQVVITGNQAVNVDYYVSLGQITNSGGTGLLVDYNNIYVGKTTIYPTGVYLPPAQVTWNPALNNPADTEGLWDVSSNWDAGILPGNVTIVQFNVADAEPCTITNAAVADAVRMGLNGAGGTLIITNGGSLVCSGANDWNSVGMNNTDVAVMDVENGATVSFANHLWIGFNPGAGGTLIMNGGTVSVAGMLGLGWSGGTGTALIHGGTLNCAQWSSSNPGSIAGASVLDVAGNGQVVINGDQTLSVSNYISTGNITANGGPTVYYAYDPGTGKTTVSATMLAPPSQMVTGMTVSGGNATLTYQTTAGHPYHVEGTPTLTPAAWATVPDSATNATGSSVTFTYPLPSDTNSMFYRTVSP